MGANSSTSQPEDDDCLTKEESLKLRAIFKSASGKEASKHHNLKEEQLKALWQGRIEDGLLQRILKFLTGSGSPSKKSVIDFSHFSKLFVHAVRGTADEKATVIAGISSGKTENVPTTDIYEYVRAIVSSYINAEKSSKQFQSWEKVGCEINSESVSLLASSLIHTLMFPGKLRKESWSLQEEHSECSLEEMTKWLLVCPDLVNMQAAVFLKLYFGAETPTGDDAICLLPMCHGVKTKGVLGDEGFPSILDMAEIIYLNAALRHEAREKWRFLFSSGAHGESFSKMLGSILSKGPSLIIIKDKDGHVFGGYATQSWKMGPQFVGSENCFLFNLRPKMNIYYTTGYNSNFMYLNVQQQTMPNGLGMGGVYEYFGLFLDSSYGTGKCGETCTTYQSPMMSSKKDFEIAHVEVWAVGPPPKTPAEMGERPSVLDLDNEAKAVLAMAGKEEYSDGLREPEDIYEPK